MRLLRHGDGYAAATLLATPETLEVAQARAEEMRAWVASVAVRRVEVRDPSDYNQLFAALPPVLRDLGGPVDVLLSAGTPQMQALWLILVEAELLAARMLRVIPDVFVPDPHPHPVAEVKIDIAGFPEIRAMREELVRLRAETRVSPGGLVAASEAMDRLVRRIRRVAPAPVPALIWGETGTGKELVARALHEASGRDGPFIAENCGALAESVLASELFGHERGAFSGAVASRRGVFEVAHGGTLFLDEVGELPPSVQVSLLRVLQEGEVRRLGAERTIPVDVRVVAATHRDLTAEVAAGRFREDLLYRLRVATLEVPPLRERPADIDALIPHFARRLDREDPVLTPAARDALHAYRWPGNVRELRAEVARWSIFCDGPVTLDDLAPDIRGLRLASPRPTEGAPGPLRAQVEAVERRVIAETLAAFGGNLSATARSLEIDRNTLKRKLHRYTLP